ncbi:MAG: hypothetical protein WD228_00770 [Mycobacterium sp.]
MDAQLPPPVAVGDRVAVTGTVLRVGTQTTELTRQIAVQRDDGGRLLLFPGDQFWVIGRAVRVIEKHDR